MTSVTQATSRARTVLWARRRRPLSTEALVTFAMCLFSTTVGVLVYLTPQYIPFTSLTLPIVVGSILLSPRTLPWFVIYDMAVLAFCISQQAEITSRLVGAVTVQVVIAAVVMASSFRRARLGVAGLRGESMFVDLRDRIVSQGSIPDLPGGWVVQAGQESAGGSGFAGDFVVAARSADGRRIDLVVVDVSGKGEAAGTRALLLSGAFNGLLNALPPDRFLSAANDYLLRQAWDEGFATAVHLSVDVETGDYEVRSAGHPPAAHLAGQRWTLLQTEGPLLGVIEGVEYTPATGHLGDGDLVLLYTDGMVETPLRDIDQGIDRLLDETEQMVSTELSGAAARLVKRFGSRDDDRAVVLVGRG